MIVDSNQCPHGLGVKGICLDPFYSLASDLNHHKPGDVIYIEKLKGITLPDGSIHDGYMIVRDRGGAIHGPNRFDFFTGSYTNTDPQNSFAAIGLAAKKNSFQYVKITGEKAEAIRKLRHFPLVPN